MLNMSDLLSRALAKSPMKNQEITVAEDDTATLKGRMEFWLAVKHA